MKKVLIFAPTAPTSGITQYILNMLSAFDTEKIHFDILSFKNPRLKAWTEAHNTEYFEFDISPYKQRRDYMTFLKNVFARDYDVVYYNTSTISGLQIFKSAKKYSNARLVINSHACSLENQSPIIRFVFTYIHKVLRVFANRYFDKKCACSIESAQWMYGKRKAEEALILKNAIDTEKFAFNKSYKEDLREKLGINSKHVVGHIGRFALPKNHSFILDVFKELSKINDDCSLVLVGEGETENLIKQKVKELSLEEKVFFVDFQEDIFRYYSLFDLFLMPSLFEAFPITLIEAQANGLCSLVSDAVTQKSNITGLIEFMSLSETDKKWAEIANKKLTGQRINTIEIICEKGYDLKQQSRQLEKVLFD